jgi:hypothetical protein
MKPSMLTAIRECQTTSKKARLSSFLTKDKPSMVASQGTMPAIFQSYKQFKKQFVIKKE